VDSISRERLEAVLQALPRLTIGLVGDLFLDRYLHLVPGSHELSIETGLEAYQIDHVRNSPGALGTVLNNLAALGVGLLAPATVIGNDGHGFDLVEQLKRLPVDPAHLLRDPDRLTPTYTKPLRPDGAGAWHELNRLDIRTRRPLGEAMTAEICRRVERLFHSSDGLIVLDQLVDEDCGVVNAAVRETLAALASEFPEKLIYVDSRRFLHRFRHATLKGNRSEVLTASGCSLPEGLNADEDRAQVAGDQEAGAQMASDQVASALVELAQQNERPAFCTLGEQGILVARPGEPARLVPGFPVTGPVDIVGAGDAATSGIVCGLLAGCDEFEAAALGNLVASITVQQLGTTGTASPAQVLARWECCNDQ
jgi:bifunctional ADP-heptose synthase (sugar kinase/adenylyltransferase)